jgi:opacity protein-like surface antigen
LRQTLSVGPCQIGVQSVAMQQWLITRPSELVAATGVRIVGTPLLSGSDTHTGCTAGFGFEHAFTERISTRIEYAHIDLGSQTQNLKFTGGTLPAIPDKVDVRMDTIRLGVNVKLTN